MNLSEEVDLEDYVSRPEKISGAEIACVVQEAGMQAVRNNRCPRSVPLPLLSRFYFDLPSHIFSASCATVM
jgi:hypothetical protein